MSSVFDVDTQGSVASLVEASATRKTSSKEPRNVSSSSKRRWRRNLIALVLFTAPAIIWYLVFMVGPFISMFYYSTLDWGGILETQYFAGLHNYTYMFSDPTFYIATRNTAIHIGVVLPILVPISFLLGYYLSLRPRGYQFLNIVCFTPTLMSAAAATMLFIGIYAPQWDHQCTPEHRRLACSHTPLERRYIDGSWFSDCY